jgi:3-hydroxyacyl-CoA dehydrogenase/3-hydroxy-2-methylbutyryl-CoA dehydrogenase
VKLGESVALVTGAASGLGAATARLVAQAGGCVVLVDLPGSAGEGMAAELGERARFVAADVTDSDAVAAAVTAAVDEFGRLDLCVNCAGICPAARVVNRAGALFPLDVFRRAIDINLVGTFDVVRHAAGAMSRNEPRIDGERGLIVLTASIAGTEGQVGQAAYAASKGALVALTLPLARDLASLGIRVMTISPGSMDTAMFAGFGEGVRDSLLDTAVFPKRAGRPDEFARLVGTFAENTYLNGEVVRLDAATRLGPR